MSSSRSSHATIMSSASDRWPRLLISLVVLTTLNVLAPIFIWSPPSLPVPSHTTQKPIKSHDWNLLVGEVALTVEDSVNYQLDTPQGAAQWHALQSSSRGFVTLSDNTTYRLSMFHALECLDTIRHGVLARKADRETLTTPDVHLCLDYLRQTIQCRADTQLEWVRSEYGPKSVQPFVTHANCRDWSKVYEELGGIL